ncbi:tail fiber protein [Galbibacter sp. EGI 63066]|uniref:tail fiber protein n=1 Tax=Galbibacter sp. EGI 63066 TaxID=2993559 RepID=UPI00224885A7|nr:tail fiber protein [Galbibacter sp. EGI 63066]MCX2680343.1 tail fiber protein [Galbibacter sp. EGI 63066]
MNKIHFTFFLFFISAVAFSQSFILPSDGKWYLIATIGGKHAFIEYIYNHTTAHNPSIVKGEIQFINSKTYIIQKQQSMGYNSWNQPQFAVINKSGTSELWIKATTGVNSGTFQIIYSKYASLNLGDTSDTNLSDNGGLLKIYEKLPDNSHVYTGNMNVLDGKVGIGTTNPDSKLTVKGNIHAQEVKLDLNGSVAPDYVFKEGYDIKTLEEVEDYIQKKGHLPNIPSAKEMEEEGIDLKAMNLKLLEKIEELTLHIIELKKTVDNQEKRIKGLEGE